MVPERRCAHCFCGCQVAVDNPPSRDDRVGLAGAVGYFADILRSVVDELYQRQTDYQHDDAGCEGCPTPADEFQSQNDHRHAQAAEAKAQLRHRDRLGAVLVEPVDDGHRQGREAAQAGADRNERPRGVEHQQRIGQGEHHEAGREDDQADAQNQAWPEAIDEPALQRPKQPALNPGQRKRARQSRLAPAELGMQRHRIGAERVHHQEAGQELDAGSSAGQPPAVENPPARADDTIDASDGRIQ